MDKGKEKRETLTPIETVWALSCSRWITNEVYLSECT